MIVCKSFMTESKKEKNYLKVILDIFQQKQVVIYQKQNLLKK